MRKILLSLLFCLILASIVSAEEGKFTVKPWIGYSSFKMDGVSDKFKNMISDEFASNYSYYKNLKNYYETTTNWYFRNVSLSQTQATVSNDESKSGNMIGIDMTYTIDKNISAGARISYTKADDAKLRQTQTINFNYDYATIASGGVPVAWASEKRVATLDLTSGMQDISLLPIMVGGSYKKDINEKFSYSGDLYVGYGFAKGTYTSKYSWLQKNDAGSVMGTYDSYHETNMSGSGFVGDVSVGGEYKFNEVLSLGLNLGYRMAKISDVKGTINNKDIKADFDFSGFISTLGLNIRF